MVVNNLRSTLSTGGMRTTTIGMVVPNGRPRYVKGISPTERQKGKLFPPSFIGKLVNSPPLFLPLWRPMVERGISVPSLRLVVQFGVLFVAGAVLGLMVTPVVWVCLPGSDPSQFCSSWHSRRSSGIDSCRFLWPAKLGYLIMYARWWDLVSVALDLFKGSMRRLRLHDIGP